MKPELERALERVAAEMPTEAKEIAESIVELEFAATMAQRASTNARGGIGTLAQKQRGHLDHIHALEKSNRRLRNQNTRMRTERDRLFNVMLACGNERDVIIAFMRGQAELVIEAPADEAPAAD